MKLKQTKKDHPFFPKIIQKDHYFIALIETYLAWFFLTGRGPFSTSVPTGLWSWDPTPGSSLSTEQLLELDAGVGKSVPQASFVSGFFKRQLVGVGSGNRSWGFPRFSNNGREMPTSDAVRVTAGRCGRGSGCGRSEKLWHLATFFDGEVARDSALDWDPFADTMLLPFLLLPFDSVGLFWSLWLMKRCNVSMRFSFVLFFVSFDEDLPHHGGITSYNKFKLSQSNAESLVFKRQWKISNYISLYIRKWSGKATADQVDLVE